MQVKVTIDQLLKILGLAFVFGSTVAALQNNINNKADKETVTAESTYTRQLNAKVDGTLIRIESRLNAIDLRLRELCDATHAGCR
jgi:hypothetical protein